MTNLRECLVGSVWEIDEIDATSKHFGHLRLRNFDPNLIEKLSEIKRACRSASWYNKIQIMSYLNQGFSSIILSPEIFQSFVLENGIKVSLSKDLKYLTDILDFINKD